MAEYSGLTGRKGTALRSVTKVLWFWVVSHTGDTNVQKNIILRVGVQLNTSSQAIQPHMQRDSNKAQFKGMHNLSKLNPAPSNPL